MYLPEQFLERLQELLGEDYENYLSSFDRIYGQTLRVNRLKTTPADLFRRFAFEPVSWCENGFYYEGEERLSLDPYYYAGVYYLQEPSAMAPAHFLPVSPGERVLDLCAAPGGKTTALAAKLQGEGVLVANDISASRCKALLKNMELAGVKNSIITCESPEKLALRFHGYFDKILVDAPCSGEGMFRKEPAMAKDWTPEVVEEYAAIQKEILSSAAKMLRPGGMLLYSTCTYSPEEDEQAVEYLLEEYHFQLQELPWTEGMSEGMPEFSKTGNPDLKNCRRFWSHRVKGEGQFAALMKKPDEENMEEGLSQVSDARKKEGYRIKPMKWTEEMEDFFRGVDLPFNRDHVILLEERVFLIPEGLPDMKGIRQIRSGLYLGDSKKKRFEPSQALAMALRKEDYKNTVSFSPEDDRVERYLKGETIDADVKDGWILICVDEYPLGWGKASKGRIKNKYYKGWRKN